MFFGIFLIELFFLFIFSKLFTRKLSSILFQITKSKTLTIYVLALIFFPGTLVHELSHYLSALILYVPVGKMTLMPKYENERLTLGSVSIAKTDTLRRTVIGASPVLVGTVLICVISYFVFNTALVSIPPREIKDYIVHFFIFYIVFTISINMFSSKKDMEGSLRFFALIIFLITSLILFGVRVDSYFLNLVASNEVLLRNLSLFLLPSVLINLTVLLIGVFVKR